MPEMIQWDAAGASYIRNRSQRYPGAVDIETQWTKEALEDSDMVAFEPDPKSRIGGSRFIGRSRAA
jgi:hypothetical protein